MGLGIRSMGTHLLKPQSVSMWVSHCRYPLSTGETHRYLWDLAAVGPPQMHHCVFHACVTTSLWPPPTHAHAAASDLRTHSHLPHTHATTFLTHMPPPSSHTCHHLPHTHATTF